MKAEKTNHLYKELMFLMAGWDSELKNRSITLAHIQASTKEIEEIEKDATAYKELMTPFKPEDIGKYYDTQTYNFIKSGTCKCESQVYEYEKHCSECGQKLDWESGAE